MAINIDNTKLSSFHTFSKTPVSANITLGNAINKAGHTVTGSEVWTDEIPYFGTMSGTEGAHALLSKDAQWGDTFKCSGDNGNEYYKRNNTAWTEGATFESLWENVTDKFVDGYVFTNKTGKGVIVYHENKYITNLDSDNNANTDSENCAARLWSDLDKEGKPLPTGQTRLIEQFVGPTDKALNGMASVDYAPVINKKGVSKPLTEGTDYSMLTVSGTVLWHVDRTNDGETYSISCFEYVGDKVSDTISDIKRELGEIETAAGAGITVSDGSNIVTGTKSIEIKGDKSASVSVAEGTDKTVVTVSVDTSNLATKSEVAEQVAGAKVTLSSNKATANTGITIDNDGKESKTFTIGIDQNVIATKKSVDDLSGVVDGINTKLSNLESLPKFKVQVVSALPETLTADMENTIFLIEDASAPGTYVEHLVFKSGESLVSEKIGTTATDLSGYVKDVVVTSGENGSAKFEGTLGTDGTLTINIPLANDGNVPGLAKFYHTIASEGLTELYNTDVAKSGATVQSVFNYGQQILNKTVDKTTYAADKLALEGSIDSKVDTTTYTAKIGEIDGKLANAATKTDLTGYVSNTDATYVKTVKVNGSEITTSGNVADIGTVIVGVDNTGLDGKGIQLSVTDDKKVKISVDTASSTVPGLVKLTSEITDGVVDATVTSDTLFDTFKTVNETIATKVGDVQWFGENDLLSTKAEIVDGVLKITENAMTDSDITIAPTREWARENKINKVVNNKAYTADGSKFATIETDKLVYSGGLFYNSTLSEFDSDLSNLESGDYMFWSANVKSIVGDMPKMTSAGYMFESSQIETFIGDLSSLENGRRMFAACKKLETFIGDLSSLKIGHGMFYYTNLAIDSVSCIADTVAVCPADATGYDKQLAVSWSTISSLDEPTCVELVGELSRIVDKEWTLTTNPELLPLFDSEKYQTGSSQVQPLDLDSEPQTIYYVVKK